MIVVGLIVIAKGGFDGPMSEPVVKMFGFTYTTTLGLIEIAIGLCLLVSAAARSRSAEVFFGAILGIAGFVGAVQTESFREQLALESGMAWIAALAGLVIVVVALLLPRFSKNSTTIVRN
jgi:peptidoglycan/LPS O-acetylase OafA/YrhL